MALKFSTVAKNRLLNGCSLSQMLTGGTMDVFDGTTPATADAAEAGTKCVVISNGGSTWTAETQASTTLTLSGSAGTVSNITVGTTPQYDILHETVTFTTDLTATAALLAAAINRSRVKSVVQVEATSDAAVVTIKAVVGSGTAINNAAVATNAGGGLSIVVANNDIRGGVANANGLTFAAASAGAISKTGTWTGTVTTGGTAKYFRLKDATGVCMIQGICGLSASDYNMSSTTLSTGASHTVDTFTLTIS